MISILILILLFSLCLTSSPFIKDREVDLTLPVSKSHLTTLFKQIRTGFKGIQPSNENEINQVIDICTQDFNPHWFKFLGRTVGNFKYDTHVTYTEGSCFKDVTISTTWLSDDKIRVDFYSYKKTSIICTDTYVITTLLHFDIHSPIFEGHSSVVYKLDNSKFNETEIVRNLGLKVMRVCDSWWRVLPDMIETATLFFDMILPKWVPGFISKPLIESEIRKGWVYQEKYLGLKYKERIPKIDTLTADVLKLYVKSGDVFMTHNSTGFDSMIISLSGKPISHTAIAMWIQKE